VASVLLFNFLFLPPVHSFTLQDSENWVALAVYLGSALVVSELAARSRRQADESALLAEVATSLVEHAASKAGIPVDTLVESGRTPIHALERLWDVEHFDRIVVPAPVGRGPGFSLKDLTWILAHAPSETVILRPDPALQADAA
jgi:two-component system sensor histidine kinase KdpD